MARAETARRRLWRGAAPDLEAADFYNRKELAAAIHRREDGRCFYCLCELPRRMQCLDHVVPLVRGGHNSYRNLVSCCLPCNSEKRDQPAADFTATRVSQQAATERADSSARFAASECHRRVFQHPAGTRTRCRCLASPGMTTIESFSSLLAASTRCPEPRASRRASRFSFLLPLC